MMRCGLRFALGLALALLAPLASAQPYPAKPITLVIGFSAGGTTDIIARVVAEELRKTFGQPIVIENRAGASGNIAGAHVARAKPDGYTLLVGSVGPLAVNASLYAKMPFDNLKDLAPVSLIAHVPNVLIVHPKALPATSFREFVALAKANPGKYFYGSTGSGTTSHMSGELLKILVGLDITHVPYKGAVALNDLLAGEQVHFMFATIPSAIQHVRAGRLRALGVSSLARSASLPDIPPIADFVPGFDASSWFGVAGPAGLPSEIAEKLSAEIARVVRIPEIRQKLVEQGADPVGSTPREFGDYMKSETEKWAKVVKAAGTKAE
jgi:tripartite-type tricarboxylate transporter receptor subunit TctC